MLWVVCLLWKVFPEEHGRCASDRSFLKRQILLRSYGIFLSTAAAVRCCTLCSGSVSIGSVEANWACSCFNKRATLAYILCDQIISGQIWPDQNQTYGISFPCWKAHAVFVFACWPSKGLRWDNVRYSAWTCWKQSHITFSDEWNVLDSKYTFYISLQYWESWLTMALILQQFSQMFANHNSDLRGTHSGSSHPRRFFAKGVRTPSQRHFRDQKSQGWAVSARPRQGNVDAEQHQPCSWKVEWCWLVVWLGTCISCIAWTGKAQQETCHDLRATIRRCMIH